MNPVIQDIKTLVFDTLFPVYCLGCNTEGLFLCADCQALLRRVKTQVCINCRQPSVAGQTHVICARPHKPNGLISAFNYADPLLDQAIIWGKYKFLPDVYQILGQLLVQYLRDYEYLQLFPNAIICPIPLAKARLRWRGFNQTELICRQLKQSFDWPILPLLDRTKNTETQKDLNRIQRINNMADSFALIDRPRIKNKTIILVDDVITTGATLLEGTKLLKRSGYEQVWCLTLARD